MNNFNNSLKHKEESSEGVAEHNNEYIYYIIYIQIIANNEERNKRLIYCPFPRY